MMTNNMNMMNDMELENVIGGIFHEHTYNKMGALHQGDGPTVGDKVMEDIGEAASTAWEVVKYVLFG